MLKRRSAFVVPAVAAVLAVAIVAFVGPFRSPVARAQSSLTFGATFDTSEDFFDRFDYGYTGVNPLAIHSELAQFHGDHDSACEGPTTDRTIAFAGDADDLDFSQLFWFCAPKGPESGHLMTGVNTFGYNIAWFSPQPTFSDVKKVCWDVNETSLSSRKWTSVLFESPDDATRYPVGTITGSGDGTSQARGTGDFDLGYTSPDFREDPGPNSGIFPQGGTLAGLKDVSGVFAWFQNQDDFVSEQIGWPGQLNGYGPTVADKAARYTHCVENLPSDQIQITQAVAPEYGGGTQTYTATGQIPSGPVRVVFEDDNYDPPKADNYDPNVVTWHWDNIQVYAGSSEITHPVVPPVAPRVAHPAAGAATAPGAATAAGVAAAPTNSSGDHGRIRQAADELALPGLVLLLALLALIALVLQREGRFARPASGSPEPDGSTEPPHD